MRVAVLGGGFAGLAAAIALQQRRHSVVLLERRGLLGGRASSYRDAASGDDVDTGPHVLFAAHRETLDLLRDAGAGGLVDVQPGLRLDWAGPEAPAPLRARVLPAPLHALAAVSSMRLGARGLRDAWRLLLRARFAGAPERLTLAALLEREGANQPLRRRLWEPLSLLLCQAPAEHVAAPVFMGALRESLLLSRRGARLAFFRRGLAEVHSALGSYFEARGGRILLGARATALELRDGRVSGVAYRQRPRQRSAIGSGEPASSERLAADAVVSAVPWHALAELLPERLRGARPFAELDRLGSAGAAWAALWLDPPATPHRLVGLVASELSWLRDTRRRAGDGSQLLIGSFAPALAAASGRGVAQLTTAAGTALRRAFHHAPADALRRALVIREPAATFDQGPGSSALRPGSATPQPGLFLAGDWTARDRPASIEAAVRSGRAAARELESALLRG